MVALTPERCVARGEGPCGSAGPAQPHPAGRETVPRLTRNPCPTTAPASAGSVRDGRNRRQRRAHHLYDWRTNSDRTRLERSSVASSMGALDALWRRQRPDRARSSNSVCIAGRSMSPRIKRSLIASSRGHACSPGGYWPRAPGLLPVGGAPSPERRCARRRPSVSWISFWRLGAHQRSLGPRVAW
jgi:hypothetical protein